jgi:iron(III) transport system ATP-binding protein
MPLLEVTAVSKLEGENFVVKNVSFSQEATQRIAIAGATGSGKSSLLKMIAGLSAPTSGSIYFNGERVKGPEERLLPGHPSIAYLSQYFELRNHYRVKDYLSMASKISEAEADNIYRLCRIETFLFRWTHQLSGGEKQRIALARLLITSPKLLLLDEPFSNLDPFHKTILKAVIEDLSNQLNITCILVSHDPVDTLSWADEILVMKNGELVQKGKPQTVYFNPVDDYTAALFGKYNRIDVQMATAFSVERKLNGSGILVRPEKLHLVSPNEGVRGKVQQVRFMGGHYEVEVVVVNQTIIVHQKEDPPAKGETVYVALR